MKTKGFTLIELIVVVAIIGLLSTLAVVALGSARVKARDAKRLSDLKQMQTALELYYTDKNAYPAGTNVTLGAGDYACLNGSGFQATGCANPYMGQVPADPQSGAYVYTVSGANDYTITATLEGDTSGLSGAIKLKPAGISKQ
ncbi:MAG: type II secretion system protein GspG [Candidatus Magasanikbacteria bacterium]|nr:type II secretion system protein GspG [Candidatus Magasanikbacteria bacterium]